MVVHSTFVPEAYGTEEAWKRLVAGSDVRLQWDPAHGPSGTAVERRAIQLGLRGDVLTRYAREWLLNVEDISAFVSEQRVNAAAPFEQLVTSREVVYPVADSDIASRLGLSNS